jgi:hypothetical protein
MQAPYVRVAEIEVDPARHAACEAAYRAHLETPHFMRYREAVEGMVRSLKLIETIAIKLAARPA